MASLGLDHFVHSAGSEGRLDHIGDGLTGVDVRYDLVGSLGVVGAVL